MRMFVGATGTILRVTVEEDEAPVDVSGATTRDFYLRKPNGSDVVGPVASTFTTDGVDGQLEMATVVGQIDIKGRWELQLDLTLGGWSDYTSIGHFHVDEPFVPR